MKFSRLIRSTFVFAMMTSVLAMSMQASLQAAVISNDQLALETNLQIQRNEVSTFLAREDVRSSLLGAGVSSNDVDSRINSLTDTQVLQIHSQMENLPAGGDGVLGVILLVIVIFILLDVAGVTDVFPGV